MENYRALVTEKSNWSPRLLYIKISTPKRILDFGAGFGEMTQKLQHYGYKFTLLEAMNDRYRKDQQHLYLFNVVAVKVIEHFPSIWEELEQIGKVLEPEGLMVFSTGLLIRLLNCTMQQNISKHGGIKTSRRTWAFSATAPSALWWICAITQSIFTETNYLWWEEVTRPIEVGRTVRYYGSYESIKVKPWTNKSYLQFSYLSWWWFLFTPMTFKKD